MYFLFKKGGYSIATVDLEACGGDHRCGLWAILGLGLGSRSDKAATEVQYSHLVIYDYIVYLEKTPFQAQI